MAKSTAKSLQELNFKTTLGETLDKLNKTRNALAVQSRIRPATINSIVDGSVKSISFETLEAILDALNEFDSTKEFTIDDVVQYRSK